MKTIDGIMLLCDAYAAANRTEANALEQGSAIEFDEAIESNDKSRAAVVAALRDMVKDAERYKWFRENAPVLVFTKCDFESKVYLNYFGQPMDWNPAEVDAAIDAAMEKTP